MTPSQTSRPKHLETEVGMGLGLELISARAETSFQAELANGHL